MFDLIESGGSSATMTCSGGSGTITLTDNDGIGDVSAGDRVALNYMNCFQESLGDVVNGRIIVDIVNLSVGEDLSVAGEVDIEIPANLTFNSIDGTFVDVEADYRVSFFATPTLEKPRYLDQRFAADAYHYPRRDDEPCRDGAAGRDQPAL